MCDPISTTLVPTAIGGAVSFVEQQRRQANHAVRAQEEAARLATANSQAQLAAISASLSRPPSIEEPLKAADESVSAARIETERRQMQKRGLMSTFTRYAGSSAGKATKLGG